MRRALPHRRMPPHRPAPRRPLHHRAHGAAPGPVRISDLAMALLGVALLGGLALAAAFALAAGTAAP